MSFPTATITQGSGLTINTLPNAGQAAMANSLSVAIASDQSAVPVTSLSSGAITNPTSVLTRPAGAVGPTSVTFSTPTFSGATLVNGQPVVLAGTVPTGGNFTSGNVYYVVGASGSNFSLAATFGGAALTGTSSGSGVTVTLVYVPNALIASSLTTPVIPSFAIATSAGGVILPRIRVLTNATFGWGGVNLSINLWSAAPAYKGGDGQPYAPSGAANWLANFLVSLAQFGDGAAGAGGLTAANQMALKLAAGTSIFWDIQILVQANPIAGQTFTIAAELLN